MPVTVPVPITATAISDAMGTRPLNNPVQFLSSAQALFYVAENQATSTGRGDRHRQVQQGGQFGSW